MMRTSSSDDAEDGKVRKRRQQKRDYATRKRLHDKQLRDSLEKQHRELSGRSRRQRQQISQLKAWATYARSYLSLCGQFLAFRSTLPSPPSPQPLPEGGRQAGHQTDAAAGAGQLETPPHQCREPCCPAEPARVREVSSTSSDPGDSVAGSPHTSPACSVRSSFLQVVCADQPQPAGYLTALLTDDFMEDGLYLNYGFADTDPFVSLFHTPTDDCGSNLSLDQTFIA